MPERKKLFLSVFKAELEDCIEDIRELSELCENRYDCREIGDYVRNENQALLHQEVVGFKDALNSIDALDPDQYDGLQSLVQAVRDLVVRSVREASDPEAVVALAERKLRKVLTYIEHRD